MFCRIFNQFEEYDYARTGSTATETVISLTRYSFICVLASGGKRL